MIVNSEFEVFNCAFGTVKLGRLNHAVSDS